MVYSPYLWWLGHGLWLFYQHYWNYTWVILVSPQAKIITKWDDGPSTPCWFHPPSIYFYGGGMGWEIEVSKTNQSHSLFVGSQLRPMPYYVLADDGTLDPSMKGIPWYPWQQDSNIMSMTSGWMTDSDRSCCGIQLLTARVELLDPIQGVVKHNLWGSINSQIHLNLNKYHRNDQILGPLVVPQSGAIGLFSSDWFLLLGVNVLFQGFLTVSRHNFYHM